MKDQHYTKICRSHNRVKCGLMTTSGTEAFVAKIKLMSLSLAHFLTQLTESVQYTNVIYAHSYVTSHIL